MPIEATRNQTLSFLVTAPPPVGSGAPFFFVFGGTA